MITFRKVSKAEYLQAFMAARQLSDRIADATSQVYEVDEATADNDAFVLASGGIAGFIVKTDGELIALFSTTKGNGSALVRHAITTGATRLDCFDGYLVELYKRHGFVESGRHANWTAGEPDVVYMVLPEDYRDRLAS